MLSIQYIKSNINKVKENIINRGFDSKKADIDRLLILDKEKNDLQIEIDKLRESRNELSKLMGSKRGDLPQELINEGKIIKDRINELEPLLSEKVKEWNTIMSFIPNISLDDVPIGNSEEENIEIKAWSPTMGEFSGDKLSKANGSIEYMPKWGSNSDKDFTPIPHYEIGKKLDLLDLETGAKVSGSRFYYLKNEGQLLMYALFDLVLKKLLKDNFIPMYVPLLVRERALFGTSHFPADADQVYEIKNDYLEEKYSLYLIGSSEPSLFSYYSDKVIDHSVLPIKMFTQSPCFRSEAGSWGKDIRGMKRVHQFEKMEMDIILENDIVKAQEIMDYLLGINEWLLRELEIPYHVINMCTSDLGYAAAAKKYDIEVFIPSDNKYMEVMSDSITTDFQSRRLNIKYKDKDGNKNYAYTINDTAATHRLLIAIIEHYQQSDGSIKIPKALQGFFDKEYIKR